MATTRKSTQGARRGAAKKASPAKKAAPAKKASPVKKTAPAEDDRSAEASTASRSRQPARRRQPEETPRSERSGGPKATPSMRTVAIAAAAELAELISRTPERIVAVEKVDDGWRVQLEVTESRRIPETTDILAVYEVDVDRDGGVTAYRRVSRYVRGRIEE